MKIESPQPFMHDRLHFFPNSQNPNCTIMKRKQSRRDIISCLPRELIVKILSLLPTNQAVATSTLSTEWKHHWTLIPTLVFPLLHREPSHFLKFVSTVLLPNHQSPIDELSLTGIKLLNHTDIPTLKKLVCYALQRRSLRVLELQFSPTHPIQLCDDPTAYKTLEVLKLDGFFRFDLVKLDTSCFQRLKVLHLANTLKKPDCVTKILQMCPVLEDVSVQSLDKSVDIFSPLLKSAKIVFATHTKIRREIRIAAPCLEYLEIVFDIFMFTRFGFITKPRAMNRVIFDNSRYPTAKEEFGILNINHILESIDEVQDLFMSCFVFNMIMNDTTTRPTFSNLTRLEIQMYCAEFDENHQLERFLTEIMQLHHLVLNVEEEVEDDGNSSCDISNRWESPTFPTSGPNWLKQSLRVIDVNCSRSFCEKHCYEFANCVLETAPSLEKLNLVLMDVGDDDMVESAQELCRRFPEECNVTT